MKKIKKVFLIALLTGTAMQLFGQDPNYTQFTNNPLYYNPAFTGLYTGIRARVSFRDQWPALPYDFKAYHFEVDLGARSLPGSGGLGLFINRDNEGIGFIKNLNIGLSFAARIRITELSVCQVGIKGSWLQKSVNWDDFVFSDALDKRYGTIYESAFPRPDQNVRNMPDFGVGFVYQIANEMKSLSGTFGFSADHLFEPDQSFLQTAKAPLPRKYVGHVEFIYAIGESNGFNVMDDNALKLNPGFIYQNQGGLTSIQAGLNLTKFGINVGVWYKGDFGSYSNSAFVVLAGYRYYIVDNLALKFTYSYDAQMAGDLMGTGGAHEISLILDFNSENLFGGSSGRSGGIMGGQGGGRRGGNTHWECPEFW